MRRLFALLALLVASAQPSDAAVLNFVLDKSGGNGFAMSEDLDGYEFGFTLFGNSTRTGAMTWTTYSATVPDIGSVPLEASGHWSYVTYDSRGPSADTFGYILNGTKTELFDKNGLASQAGLFSFYLSTGDTLGWYVDSMDGLGGRAVVGVTANVSTVPLPAAGLLLLGGMAGLGAAAKRRRVSA